MWTNCHCESARTEVDLPELCCSELHTQLVAALYHHRVRSEACL